MFNIPDLISVLNQPELTQQTWDTLLRKPDPFHWYIAPSSCPAVSWGAGAAACMVRKGRDR